MSWPWLWNVIVGTEPINETSNLPDSSPVVSSAEFKNCVRVHLSLPPGKIPLPVQQMLKDELLNLSILH